MSLTCAPLFPFALGALSLIITLLRFSAAAGNGSFRSSVGLACELFAVSPAYVQVAPPSTE